MIGTPIRGVPVRLRKSSTESGFEEGDGDVPADGPDSAEGGAA
jgi:hypothetical protein